MQPSTGFAQSIPTVLSLLNDAPPAKPMLMVLSFQRDTTMPEAERQARLTTLHQQLQTHMRQYNAEYASGKGRDLMTLSGPPAMYKAILADTGLCARIRSLRKYVSLKTNI